MVEMAILGGILSVQRDMNGTDSGCLSVGTYRGGELFLYMEGYFVPDPSFSSV